MSPRQPAPDRDESTEDPKHDRPGEVKRDEERDDRGIVYHGADWDRAEEENERGVVEHSADEERDSDIERGGKGMDDRDAAPERDDEDDENQRITQRYEDRSDG